MKSSKLLLVGGGGHCLSVLDSIKETKLFDHVGIIDNYLKVGSFIESTRIVGSDEDLTRLFKSGYTHAFVTIGSIGHTYIRRRIYSMLIEIGFEIPNIIDGSAIVSENCELGTGIFIGKYAVINSKSTIGNCCIINTGVLIEHECQIGDFVHLATGAVLGGNCIIKSDTHIGSNSSVKNNIVIGENSLIGLGSVVVNSIDSNVVAYGNPCKGVKSK